MLMAVAMAGLIYSKYQAVLVIGFVILSNLKLLRMLRFWIAGIVAILLLIPHIYWQISSNFPSLQYHLIDRSEGFRWLFILEYLPNQMAVLNPFVFGAVIFVMIKYKPAGDFMRSLYFQIAGFIIFFWLSAVQGHVEPQWTIACTIPVIIVLSGKIIENPGLMRFARRFILPSILLLIFIRILMMTDLGLVKNLGYAGREERYEAIAAEAKELPVVFTGSFQKPSLYTFFTGNEAIVLSSLYSRQTQYDLWQFENNYHNKPVFVSVPVSGRSKVFNTGRLQFHGFRVDRLQTVNRVKIIFSMDQTFLVPGDTVRIPFSLTNTYDHDIDFGHPEFPVGFCMDFLRGEEEFFYQVYPSESVGIIPPGETVSGSLSGIIPDLAYGNYRFGISLNTLFGPAFNSSFIKVMIKKYD
jgi:hypothetical protein